MHPIIISTLTLFALQCLLPADCLAQAKGAGSDVLYLTFDDVEFEMEKGEEFERGLLTEKIKDLVGKRISIRGFILPNGTRESGNQKFILVRDNKECCFGPGAALYDCVLVKLEKGHEVDFTVRPVTVEGTFQLKELVIGGRTMAIYRMRDCKVSQ
tara:strand:+ start:289 stop:756 length:468 start_codon:yes stop_codon:yes gene_type:complete